MVQTSDKVGGEGWEKQAHLYLRSCEYETAIAMYEQAIAKLNEYLSEYLTEDQYLDFAERQSELRTRIYRNYVYSGIAMLLQGQEQEAQMAWLYIVNDLTESETERFCFELLAALASEAQHQESLSNWSNAWLLCRYACENAPNLENWMRSLQVSLQASLQAVKNLGDDQLELDWEAFAQVMELLIEQKFVISQDLIPTVFTIFTELRSQYPEAVENLSGEAYYYLGLLYRRELKIYEAIAEYQRALERIPERLEVYESLLESLGILVNSGLQVYSDWRQVAEVYVQVCRALSESINQSNNHFHLPSASSLLKSYLMSGMYEAAVAYFSELETQIYRNPEHLTERDWRSLYEEMLFFVPFLRDDPISNGQLFEFIADQYRKFCLTNFFDQYPQFQLVPKFSSITSPVTSALTSGLVPKRSLRIGIMSGLFRRHANAWCTKDWLFELAKIAPDLQFYLTAQFPSDDVTQKYEQFGDRLYKIKATSRDEQAAEMIQKLIDDDLDILIESDAIMNIFHATIMAAKPAKHCISWPGFAAPYLSGNNYFLGDRHLLPPEVEPYYLEKLLRMPDSYLAISELASLPIDREAVRRSMGIEPNQVVYLSISAGHKFNPDTAEAIAQILHRVPDSIFLHKGKGDLRVVKGTYDQACDRYRVNSDRIKFLPARTKTEEEHRSTYQLADVLLDSYPYNSCTHSLEAFWQNLPVITIVGKQMFSRFGYSFFQTLGIQEGIAWNWEEYVEWGERFGKDSDLRESLRSHLQQSKQPETLSPLWNPRKFAEDLYDLLLTL